MKKIKKKLPLDKYINQALYDNHNGYYMKNLTFDKYGDFITSPNVSILFSEMIGLWIVMYWQKLGRPKKFNVIELGAGNGEMMFQIINILEKFIDIKNCLNFYIIEKSNFLKKVQKEKLKKSKIIWLDNINKLKSNKKCLFFGNEFLDAFPIKQFEKINNIWFEKYIYEYKNKRYFKNVKANIKKYIKVLGKEFTSNQNFIEFSPEQEKFLKNLSRYLKKNSGGVLLIDYGYFKSKMFNTLQSVKNHKKNNILLNKGNADITHLINFKLLKKIFLNNGLKVSGVTSQGEFLKKMGIFERAEIISKNKLFNDKVRIYSRVKRITDKYGMGGQFKVIFASHKSINFNLGF